MQLTTARSVLVVEAIVICSLSSILTIECFMIWNFELCCDYNLFDILMTSD